MLPDDDARTEIVRRLLNSDTQEFLVTGFSQPLNRPKSYFGWIFWTLAVLMLVGQVVSALLRQTKVP